MKKTTEYDSLMIKRCSRELNERLVNAIYEIFEDKIRESSGSEESWNMEIDCNCMDERFTNISIWDNMLIVDFESQDGEYSDNADLSDLNIVELTALWEYLNDLNG